MAKFQDDPALLTKSIFDKESEMFFDFVNGLYETNDPKRIARLEALGYTRIEDEEPANDQGFSGDSGPQEDQFTEKALRKVSKQDLVILAEGDPFNIPDADKIKKSDLVDLILERQEALKGE